MNNSSIHKILTNKFGELRDGTSVIEKLSELNLENNTEGVLLLYANWSKQALFNLSSALDLLYSTPRAYKIFILDTDSISADDQVKSFGQTLGGWGEIFLFRDGKFQKKYFGYDCFNNFRRDYLSPQHSDKTDRKG